METALFFEPPTNYENFWRRWFGSCGREALHSFLDYPERHFYPDFTNFPSYIEKCVKFNSPPFMSVLGYSSRGQQSVFEKLFFDFDSKENPEKAKTEALDFKEKLEKLYNIKSLPVLSGNKGCHIYIWNIHPLEFPPENNALIKEAYRRLQKKLLKKLHYETLDTTTIGDISRLARIPCTQHEKNGRLCEPLDDVSDLEVYRKSGIPDSFVIESVIESKLILEERKNEKKVPFKAEGKGVRRQIQLLISKAQNGERLDHLERLAVACELIRAGRTDEEIVKIFSKQSDFDYSRTRYFVEHARRRGYKPIKLSTLKK